MVILVGVGLANACLALTLVRRRPELSLTLIDDRGSPEQRPVQTWSFHDSDVGAHADFLNHPWVRRWPSYEVAFPQLRRVLDSGYASIASTEFWPQFDAMMRQAGVRTIVGRAKQISDAGVELEDGQRIAADGATTVVDGRGLGGTSFAAASQASMGYQKFLGWDVRVAKPHGLQRPILMDATVEQLDGYRFVYVLPLDETTLLIEDTYYSDTPDLDQAALRLRIEAYAARKGWRIESRLREEVGCLPIPLTMEAMFEHVERRQTVATVGVRGGLYHAVTGYSLPSALALAWELSEIPRWNTATVAAAVTDFRAVRASRDAFYCFLNRMLFKAARPEQRFKVLQRFYGLSPDLIGRFYRGDWRWGDAVRILAGKPPVPVMRAMRCVRGGMAS